jgi:hypothetical protein
MAPLEGWRRAETTEWRTKKDWSYQIKKLVDLDFPDAEKIILVMDNLNTHAIGSLYETFPPEQARRIREKLEIHFTPKHGSRLAMAETELNVLINHGLSARIPTMKQTQKETKAWNNERNETAKKINRRFTTEGARIKLHRLYPHLHDDRMLASCNRFLVPGNDSTGNQTGRIVHVNAWRETK